MWTAMSDKNEIESKRGKRDEHARGVLAGSRSATTLTSCGNATQHVEGVRRRSRQRRDGWQYSVAAGSRRCPVCLASAAVALRRPSAQQVHASRPPDEQREVTGARRSSRMRLSRRFHGVKSSEPRSNGESRRGQQQPARAPGPAVPPLLLTGETSLHVDWSLGGCCACESCGTRVGKKVVGTFWRE